MERPFVYVNMAMTADGKITSSRREYPRFTSDFDRRRMDRLRARADAILVGAGTMRADDPPLRVRDPEMRELRRSLGKPDGLDRILVTASARLAPENRFLREKDPGRRIIATVEDAPEDRIALLEPHAEILRQGRGRVALAALLAHLRREGIESLLVEGGAEVNGQLLEEDLVDEIYLTLAPTLLGGRDAPTPFGGTGLAMSGQRRLKLLDVHREGDEMYLRYAVER